MIRNIAVGLVLVVFLSRSLEAQPRVLVVQQRYLEGSEEFSTFELAFAPLRERLSDERKASVFFERVRDLGYVNHNLVQAFVAYVDEQVARQGLRDESDCQSFFGFMKAFVSFLEEEEVPSIGPEAALLEEMKTAKKQLEQEVLRAGSAASAAADEFPPLALHRLPLAVRRPSRGNLSDRDEYRRDAIFRRMMTGDDEGSAKAQSARGTSYGF